jgi:transcription antitermination factor NusA-like protein
MKALFSQFIGLVLRLWYYKIKIPFINFLARERRNNNLTVKQICTNIGHYYFNRTLKEMVADESGIELCIYAAQKQISELNITKVTYNKSMVTITLGRVGAFIGKKGNNIIGLEDFLSEKMGKKIKINLKENEPYLYNLFDFTYTAMTIDDVLSDPF